MIDFLIDFIQTEKFLVLLGLGLTALIVWLTEKTTRLKWREMKQTKPLIVSVKRYEKDSVKFISQTTNLTISL